LDEVLLDNLNYRKNVKCLGFSGKSVIDRHRAINSALSDEFTAGLHALSIAKAATPEQWSQSQNVNQSPACLGGAKFERALAEARAAQQK
jgi:acid stress-induced BolA-like protein IbaG/YrbA